MRNDWKLKIVSLILAVFVWFHAITEKVYVTPIVLNVRYENVPQNLYMLGEPPEVCTLWVRGKGKTILTFSLKKPIIEVNLQGLKVGTHTIELNPPKISNLEIVSIRPKEVQIYIDRGKRKNLPVKPIVTGNPAPDYALVEVHATPKKITIEGPASLVSKIKVVKTETLTIDENNKNSFARKVAVMLDPEYAKFVKPLPETVSVSVILHPKDTVELEVPVKLKNKGRYRVKVEPKKVSLTLKVHPKYTKRINRYKVKLWVDLEGLKKGEYELPVQYELPDYAELIALEPKKVKVVIR
ncbi:MAG: hypothetical protein DRQ10_07200 [Candidatus Hydrothermota bacterium]|nr:MAG: hypothetical protein DRQ10_07200 [Candidatus Hydrothermae bacterium]